MYSLLPAWKKVVQTTVMMVLGILVVPTQEPVPKTPQASKRRDPTAPSQAVRSKPRASTSKPKDPKRKHCGSGDGRSRIFPRQGLPQGEKVQREQDTSPTLFWFFIYSDGSRRGQSQSSQT